MNRFKQTLSSAALAFAAATAQAAPATDLNGDKAVDAADAQEFLTRIAAGTPPSLDLDGDGRTGLADALLYGRWIDGLWEKPQEGYGGLSFKNPLDSAVFARYKTDLKADKDMTLAGLQAAFPDRTVSGALPTGETLQFEAEVTSAFAALAGPTWNKAAFMAKVRSEGMAVSQATAFPNFFQAIDKIHHHDLPLLFTSDALLHTVYQSYDNILAELEENLLYASLESILAKSKAYAVTAYGQDQAGRDVVELLGTGLLLLDKNSPHVEPTAAMRTHLANIAALQLRKVPLWGRDTTVDFSQFKPRGHYTRTLKLERYFQAMMWLSRADLAFDLRGDPPAEKAASYTRMKKAAIALWDCLVNSGSYAAWLEFDHYIAYLVGPSDGLNARGMGLIMQGLGAASAPALLASFPEERFDSVLAASRLGAQAILSQEKGFDSQQDPDLSPIFNFMPQRFILDSYTFSQMVYPLTEAAWPSVPGLAFVMGDNAAAKEPAGGVPPGVLSAQRKLYDGLSEEYWQSNLYTSWLGFLRKLNGAEANAKAAPVFRSQAWRVKTRNTQQASWAQLRHNTLLYAKQSYTGTVICSFPTAYVEPYPEFFAGVAAYAKQGNALFRGRQVGVAGYFATLESISLKLRDVALRTAEGLAPAPDQMTWLRAALTMRDEHAGCTVVKVLDGWYPNLIYGSFGKQADQKSYTIADVHTKPMTDELGQEGVLHVGTGPIHLAAVAVRTDSCTVLFAAPVGSFYEARRLGSLERMTDEEWTKSVDAKPPTRPAWMQRIMAP